MKNLKWLTVLGVLAGGMVMLSHSHRNSAPVASMTDATVVELDAAKITTEETSPKADGVNAAVAATDAAVSVGATESPSDLSPGDSSEITSDVELAYQLGEDIASMAPEARARLRADWEQRARDVQ